MAHDPIRAGGTQRAAALVEGAGGERDVADGAVDAGHGADAVDRGARQRRAGDDVDLLGVLALPDGDGRVGAHDGVDGGEPPGARRARAPPPSAARRRRRA